MTAPADGAGEGFADLLAAARRGSGAAFERLYHQHARHLHGFLRAQRVADPEGVTNEAFRRAFTSIADFQGAEDGQFRAWVFAIARNLVIDEQRHNARRPTLVLVADGLDRESPDATEDAAIQRLDRGRAEELLAQLPPDQRDVLTLRIIGGLSAEEVGNILGKRPGAVRALQLRGLRRLRRLIDAGQISIVEP